MDTLGKGGKTNLGPLLLELHFSLNILVKSRLPVGLWGRHSIEVFILILTIVEDKEKFIRHVLLNLGDFEVSDKVERRCLCWFQLRWDIPYVIIFYLFLFLCWAAIGPLPLKCGSSFVVLGQIIS
jgi:hypothetical protein